MGVFEIEGIRVGLLICEDAWFDEPARLVRDAGAQVLAVLNASPFHAGKSAEREQRMRERVADCGLPLIYAHLVGGQDEVLPDRLNKLASEFVGKRGVVDPLFDEFLALSAPGAVIVAAGR